MSSFTRLLTTRCAFHGYWGLRLAQPHLETHNQHFPVSRFSSEADSIRNDISEEPPDHAFHTSPEWKVDILQKEEDVLNAFNTLNQAQLYKYRHLSSRLSKAITDDRESAGPYGDLSDLLRVRGMGQRTLDRFISEGLRPRGIRIEPLTRHSYAVSGAEQISQEKLEAFETVLTIDIGLRQVAWLCMDRGRNVRDWRLVDLGEIYPGKYDPVAYLKALQRILDEMPQADLHILEHRSYDRTNKSAYHITLFLRTLESLLFGLLNSGYGDTGEIQCVSLSQQRVGKHFGLLVGTRRRSGKDVVQKLLETADNPLEDEKVLVRFRPEDYKIFNSCNNFQRELLSNVVLKAVTFFDAFVDNRE